MLRRSYLVTTCLGSMCAMWDLSKVFDYKGRLKTSAVSHLNSFKPVFTLDNLKKIFFTTVSCLSQFKMIQIKSIITAVLGLTVATCTPIVQRSAATVLTDLATIGTDLSTLTTAVQSYTGGLTAALVIATDETTLDTAINQATTDATAASSFTTSESTSVVAAVASLAPMITTGLSALASKVFCMNSNLQFVRCSLPNFRRASLQPLALIALS